MKEASGEANLTVVAIILIGVIAAVVTPLIRSTMNKTKERTDCNDQIDHEYSSEEPQQGATEVFGRYSDDCID